MVRTASVTGGLLALLLAGTAASAATSPLPPGCKEPPRPGGTEPNRPGGRTGTEPTRPTTGTEPTKPTTATGTEPTQAGVKLENPCRPGGTGDKTTGAGNTTGTSGKTGADGKTGTEAKSGTDKPSNDPGKPPKGGPQKAAEEAKIGGRTVNIWRPKGDGAAPIVIFSHGYGGCPTQSTFMTEALSQFGYLVIAPRHADAKCGSGNTDTLTTSTTTTSTTAGSTGGSTDGAKEPGFSQPSKWSADTYSDRRDDITAVVKALKADSAWQSKIDWTKFGLLGHSLGGYTVLGLAGAWPSWKLEGVKAVVTLSPYCKPFLEYGGSLGDVATPISYQGGTRDTAITPSLIRKGGCYDTTRRGQAVIFKDVSHFSFTDHQDVGHAGMVFYAQAAFDAWLLGKSSVPLQTSRDGVLNLEYK